MTTPSNISQHRINKVEITDAMTASWSAYKQKILDADTKGESEEHQKKIFNDLLKDTFGYDVNTKGRQDNAIFNEFGDVEVIIEWKRLKETKDMPTANNLNVKATQQALYYYLQETIDNKSIKHIIISNGRNFLIWDAVDFENIFGADKKLQKHFEDFSKGGLIFGKTDQFYANISQPAIDRNLVELMNKAIILDWDSECMPKVLAPQYLLKKSLVNINSLNQGFYSELLYIMGLEEKNQGGITTIIQLPAAGRQTGSLLENVLLRADDFETGLEVVITWVNRILFLKLLEGQILDYNSQNPDFAFLTLSKVTKYKDLKRLFFDVLAVEVRNPTLSKGFENVPYLNSSLFLETELEKQYGLQELDDDYKIAFHPRTILRDDRGHQKTGTTKGLDYLLEFLEAYNFSQVKNQESTQDIINSSVLGSFFEKLNGYKDGSFYTPSTITEHISKTCLHSAILSKFYSKYNIHASTISELRIELKEAFQNGKLTRQDASELVNTLRIVDPAVGSGYFLVSCLNQILHLKSRLGILLNKDGELLDCDIEIQNDELVIYQNNKKYEYAKDIASNAIIQESLFLEKQKLIENCIFGVDINPNSVKICQLRMWIELLKNTYYQDSGKLQTLPNIDINIKCGNSLLSRFATSQDLAQILRNNNQNIDQYRQLFTDYQTAKTKLDRKDAETKIADIKANFEHKLSEYSPLSLEIDSINKQLDESLLFSLESTQKAKLTKLLDPLLTQREYIGSGRAYQHAFEWRFEFPQVLDENGHFHGFDIVVGNPPYIGEKGNKEIFDPIKSTALGQRFYQGKMDLFYFFFHLGLNLVADDGLVGYITTNYYITATGAAALRKDMKERSSVVNMINFGELKIFDSAQGQHNLITILRKNSTQKIQLEIPLLKNGKSNTNELHSSSNSPLVRSGAWVSQDKAFATTEGWQPQADGVFRTPSENTDNQKSQALNAKVIITTNKGKLNHSILHSIVSGKDTASNYYDIPQSQLFKNGNMQLTAGAIDDVLDKMAEGGKILGEICEVNSGADITLSEITKKHSDFIGDFNLGDGCFVVDSKKILELNLSSNELKHIKNFIKSSDINKYGCNNSDKRLIYFRWEDSILDKNNLEIHLLRFKPILDDQIKRFGESYPYYAVHRPRKQEIFDSKEKILVPYRTKSNTFGYSIEPIYSSRDIFFITQPKDNYTLKFLLGVLNSKIIYKWLYYRGKRKGEMLELYQEPLSKIPIPVLDTPERQLLATQIEALVEEILRVKETPRQPSVATPLGEGNSPVDTADLESQIDALVYQLYDLTAVEVGIVGG